MQLAISDEAIFSIRMKLKKKKIQLSSLLISFPRNQTQVSQRKLTNINPPLFVSTLLNFQIQNPYWNNQKP